VNGQTGRFHQQPAGRVMGTGTCIALIAIGAILRFAVAAGCQDQPPQ
jgi:hypothetical protein